MTDNFLISQNIVHAGALLYLAAFMFRNQIMLRALIIAGNFVYILFFYFMPDVPLWSGIFWSSLFTIVNLIMIALLLADNMHFGLDRNEKRLYELLEDLTPGQFRQFLKAGQQGQTTSRLVIAREGKPVEELYFVLDKKMQIEKKGNSTSIESDTFVGEVGFLLSQPASATVTLEPQTPYFVWNARELKNFLNTKSALGTSLSLAMNKKMARKVASGGWFLGESMA